MVVAHTNLSRDSQIDNRLRSNACLDVTGRMWEGVFAAGPVGWEQFSLQQEIHESTSGGYIHPLLPVEFHCHGIGPFDFSDFENLDLNSVDALFHKEGVQGVLTLFLPYEKRDAFGAFMQDFASERRQGRLRHIAGIALEGPLLSSTAGTPEPGTWAPTRAEWRQIARWGSAGLRYTVLSPDAMAGGGALGAMLTADHPTLEWITELLLDSGISPALGHFQKAHPARSARCIETVLKIATRKGTLSYPSRVLTDHLFNDMPRAFRHAWRTPTEKRERTRELQAIAPDAWNMDDLDEKLGIVPATLIRAATEGQITLCLNFDGEHVDPAFCHRVVKLVGPASIVAMTDRVDGRRLLGRKLTCGRGETLLRRDDGLVAAGTQSIDRQIQNMRALGLSEKAIWMMASIVPSQVLGIAPEYTDDGLPRMCSVFGHDHTRTVYYTPSCR